MTASRDSGPGSCAEDLVAARLAAAGWEIVERNARTRFGELDIVALDGRTLVFVEVKAGRAGSDLGPERPVLAVGPRKQRRIRRLATAWMAERRGDATPLRGDPLRRRRRHLRPRRADLADSSTSATPSEPGASRPAARAASRRPTGTSGGAAARSRSARSPRGARGSSSRRAPRTPSPGWLLGRRPCM